MIDIDERRLVTLFMMNLKHDSSAVSQVKILIIVWSIIGLNPLYQFAGICNYSRIS